MLDMNSNLKERDTEIFTALQSEVKRQQEGLELIPSENYVSMAVLQAIGSVLTNKYSEGYPKKRYYGGNKHIDEIEEICRERLKELFTVPHANVQPYSGSPANFVVYLATCEPGDTFMGLNLPDGGHLTHGWKVSATSKIYKSVPYHVKKDGRVDMDEIRELAQKHKPKLLWTGATAYVYEFQFKEFAEIADSVGAYFAADIAHIAGLIVAGVHQSPVDHADIITSTTHKTLRGPRAGIIMVTEKGLKKDGDLAKKIDHALFPGLQGGPHNHITAGIAVALKEAMTQEFKDYGQQIVKNAKALAASLRKYGLDLVGDGTENHMVLIDLVRQGGCGAQAEFALDEAGITVNKNTVPFDPNPPFYPSGIRIGTPAITTRGMKEPEMDNIAHWISQVIDEVQDYKLPLEKNERAPFLRNFRQEIVANPTIKKIREEVRAMCAEFPLYTSL